MDEIVPQNVSEDTIQIQFQREIKQLDESNKEIEQRIRKLETKAVQNVNLYFIFQAVILMSTAAATSLTCRHWWLPFSLSVVAAVQNLFAFSRSMLGVLKLREELDQDSLDLEFIKLHRIKGAQVKQAKPGTKLLCDPQFQQGDSQSQVGKGENEIVRPKPGPYHKWRGRLLSYSPMALFVVFSCLMMYGCYILLCHTNGGKCTKLC